MIFIKLSDIIYLYHQERKVTLIMNKIQRTEYLNKLIAFRDKKIIKVITGVRRCGKSTLMQIYQDYLRDNGVEEKCIVSVNLEDYDYYELSGRDTTLRKLPGGC